MRTCGIVVLHSSRLGANIKKSRPRDSAKRRTLSAVLLLAILAFLLTPPIGHAQQPATLTFDIRGYQIEGNTLLDSGKIQRLLAPYTGTARDFGDVQRAVAALEKAYASAGYGAVKVVLPEQELAGGMVRIQAIEGRVRAITTGKHKYFDAANLRRSLPALKEGTAPNARRIADNIRLANENPAKQTNVLLRQGAQPGDIDAVIEATEERPYRAFVTVDNTGSPSTGMLRAGIGLQHANLFNRDHVFTAQYITAPEDIDKVTIFSLGYHAPLYALGDSLDLYAGYSDVDAGTSITAAGPLSFSGSGKVAGARYNQLFARLGEYEHKLAYGADYKLYDNVCSLGAFGPAGCGTAASTIAVHPLSLTYEGKWARPGSVAGFYAGAHRNVPGGTYGKDEDFKSARVGAGANYTLFRAGFHVARSFAGDLQVRLAMMGQYTEDALIPGEQFGLGGANSVRGFLEREVANDRGYSGQLEVYTPDVARALGAERSNLRALAFFDYGRAERNDPVPGDVTEEEIASAGFGVRLSVGKYFSLRGDVARVVKAGGTQSKGDVRGHFSVFASF